MNQVDVNHLLEEQRRTNELLEDIIALLVNKTGLIVVDPKREWIRPSKRKESHG